MHAGAGLHPRGEQRDELRLDQAPLVMALLRPGIWKENMHAVERGRGDHVAQHFDRVVLDDAHVLETQVGDALQQTPHARGMHFDSEIIVLRVLLGDVRRGLAHAEADLEDLGRRAAEHADEVKRGGGEGYAVYGQQIGVGAALGFRDAPLAQYETSNLAPVFLQEMFGYAAFGEIRPEEGELALAE